MSLPRETRQALKSPSSLLSSLVTLARSPTFTHPAPLAALSVSWSAGQAWSTYNSLIGALIPSISARGSSWLQMKWIWFGLWLQAKHLLRPGAVIEEEMQARWNQRDWCPANHRVRPSVLLVWVHAWWKQISLWFVSENNWTLGTKLQQWLIPNLPDLSVFGAEIRGSVSTWELLSYYCLDEFGKASDLIWKKKCF